MIPEDLIEQHVAAFTALLQADAEIAGSLFDGDVTGDPQRWTNVFHDTGVYEGHSLGNEPVDVTVTFTVHNVGVERWQAVWGSGRVAAAVLGRVPNIPGRRCWRITPAGTQPVRKDDTVTPVKFLAVDRYTFRSTPA